MRLSRRDALLAGAASAVEVSCGGALPPSVCGPPATPGCPAPKPIDSPLPALREELFAFDEIHRESPTVYHPKDESELGALLASIPSGRRATLRGGGQALDAQSLNGDVVISLGGAFNHIGAPKLDQTGYYLSVGAGARWWDVLGKLAPLGFFPPSLATAGHATVGGTLSADCVSRMSCTAGKEGAQIRSFRIVLTDGRILECSRDDSDPEKSSLFSAVIGGFGYLGAVTQVTFDLMVARSHPNVAGPSPAILTRSTRHGATVDWHELLQALHSQMRVNRDAYRSMRANCVATGRPPTTASAPEWPALSIASFLSSRSLSANLLQQGFVENRPLKPSPGGVYDQYSTFTANAEVGTAAWPTPVEFGLELGFPEGDFVDELFGWAFFLHNSVTRAKAMAHKSGKRLNFTQQSFALPSGHDEHALDTRPTRRFVELMLARLHAADVRPVNIDFLYVPADDFLMSASRNLPSFVVTLAFSGIDQPRLAPEIFDLLCAMSHDCRTLGGRVHLVKNVVADGADLRIMHGDAAQELRRLKRQFDPRGILRNEFFDRVFDA